MPASFLGRISRLLFAIFRSQLQLPQSNLRAFPPPRLGQIMATANRAEAIRHHAGRIEEINSREVKAAQELAKRHDSLAGRLFAFTKKGRDRQEQERNALTDRFENDRMKQHRDLAARRTSRRPDQAAPRAREIN
jgi:hypothetical protein